MTDSEFCSILNGLEDISFSILRRKKMKTNKARPHTFENDEGNIDEQFFRCNANKIFTANASYNEFLVIAKALVARLEDPEDHWETLKCISALRSHTNNWVSLFSEMIDHDYEEEEEDEE